MNFYELLGYIVGYTLAIVFLAFMVIPFIIIFALFNDKTYNNVKAEINNRPTLWQQITKQK